MITTTNTSPVEPMDCLPQNLLLGKFPEPTLVYHRETRKGMVLGEPLYKLPGDDLCSVKFAKSCSLKERGSKYGEPRLSFLPTRQRRVYYRYFLAVLVQPFEGFLLVTDREMTFGHPSMLCGIGKPYGCRQL